MALLVAQGAAAWGGKGAMSIDPTDLVAEDILDPTQETKIKLKRPDGKPTDVYSWFEITLQDIDVPSQTFQASIEIHLFWQDYNLPNVFPNYEEDEFELHNDCVPVKMSEIFENKTAIDLQNEPVFTYYPSTGTIKMMFVVDCSFVERMELQRFPLDRQFMNMEFNARIKAALENEGPWNWILEYPSWMPAELKADYDKPFCVRMISSITEYELLDPWIDFSGEQPLSIRIRVNRLPAYYFGNIVFPNFLIVLGCFAAFVIPKSDIADRLSVTVTLMLAAVAFRFVVSTMLPKVSYLTIMDYYLLTGFIALILLIVENGVVGIPGFRDTDAAQYIDTWCFIIFSSLWIIIHVIALWALLNKEFMRLSWAKMDEIDSAEDEEDEFVFADMSNVKGKKASEECTGDWEKYKKYSVMERANIYAKSNGIKRSGTFGLKLQEERSKNTGNEIQQMDTLKEEEEGNKDENDTTAPIEVYVVPKSKVPKQKEKTPPTNIEEKVMNSIQLSQIKKEAEPEPKKESEPEPKQELEPEPEPKHEPEPEPEEEPKEDDNTNENEDQLEKPKEAEYVVADISEEDKKDEKQDENDNDNGNDEETDKSKEESPNDDFVKVETETSPNFED